MRWALGTTPGRFRQSREGLHASVEVVGRRERDAVLCGVVAKRNDLIAALGGAEGQLVGAGAALVQEQGGGAECGGVRVLALLLYFRLTLCPRSGSV